MKNKIGLAQVVRILPRHKLEELSGVDSPWHRSRRDLELKVIAIDSADLRDEIAAYVASCLRVRP